MEKHPVKNRPSYTIRLIFLIALLGGYVTSSYIRAEQLESCFDSEGNLFFSADCAIEDSEEGSQPEASQEPFSMEMEAIDLEQFKAQEPNWEPVAVEFSVTGLTMDDCCLRAIRGTKTQADERCKAKGKRSWQVISTPPEKVEGEPIKIIQNCYVYTSQKVDSEYLFSCHARAVSKCAWQSEFKF